MSSVMHISMLKYMYPFLNSLCILLTFFFNVGNYFLYSHILHVSLYDISYVFVSYPHLLQHQLQCLSYIRCFKMCIKLINSYTYICFIILSVKSNLFQCPKMFSLIWALYLYNLIKHKFTFSLAVHSNLMSTLGLLYLLLPLYRCSTTRQILSCSFLLFRPQLPH